MKNSIIPTLTSKDRVMIQSLLKGALHVSEKNKRLICFVPVYLMKIDYAYQREIKHNGLLGKWDPDKSSMITLSYRKGEPDVLYVIDGQHRVEAARKNGTESLVAEIFLDLTVEEEAEMFATQNDSISKVATSDTYKANLVYGEEIDTSISNVCKRYGVIVSRFRKPKYLSGLGEARINVRMYGEKCLDWIMGVVDAADWDVHKQPYTASWLRAFRFAYSENISDVMTAQNNLIKTLVNCNPAMISVFASVSYPNLESRKAVCVALDKIAKGIVNADNIKHVTRIHM